jgi:L-lactate dehydrogenase complex protein LldG
MNSRDLILDAIAKNQAERSILPVIMFPASPEIDSVEKFAEVAVSIGSRVFKVNKFEEIKQLIRQSFSAENRIVSTFPELAELAETNIAGENPHALENVDLAILKAHFGVAENSALWVTEELLPARVLPFICQHLALVVSANQILPLMHHAYEKIGKVDYGYGAFIAGPSKTADIEQSLVLGAHGPRTLTVFILEE